MSEHFDQKTGLILQAFASAISRTFEDIKPGGAESFHKRMMQAYSHLANLESPESLEAASMLKALVREVHIQGVQNRNNIFD